MPQVPLRATGRATASFTDLVDASLADLRQLLISEHERLMAASLFPWEQSELSPMQALSILELEEEQKPQEVIWFACPHSVRELPNHMESRHRPCSLP